MSDHTHGRTQRECRRCGAQLAAWHCATCGASALEMVASTYIAELATAWRVGAEGPRAAGAGPFRVAA